MSRYLLPAVLPTILPMLLGAALSVATQVALAQRPATTDKRVGVDNALAMCTGCHGIPGYKTAFPNVYHVPKIAGQQPAYLVNALKAYKSGERSHPSMRGIASTLSEEEMKQLADYYGGGK